VSKEPANASGELDAQKLVEEHRGGRGRFQEREELEKRAFERPDFRKERRSRDVPISFKLYRETYDDLRELANAEGLNMVQIFERALALYKETMQGKR
jgi:hypothetical protein